MGRALSQRFAQNTQTVRKTAVPSGAVGCRDCMRSRKLPSLGGRSIGRRACSEGGYLVDPASSHMLVSKIKPCMSKYKLLIL